MIYGQSYASSSAQAVEVQQGGDGFNLQNTSPSAPKMITLDQLEAPTVTVTDLHVHLKNKFPDVNKDVLKQFMEALTNIKSDKNYKHRDRVTIFSQMLGIPYKEAEKYYKVMKTIWKFQGWAKKLKAYMARSKLAI